MEQDIEKQQPFKISMMVPTNEMLGKYLLGKLETTTAWVVPIYEAGYRRVAQTPAAPEPIPDDKLRDLEDKIFEAIYYFRFPNAYKSGDTIKPLLHYPDGEALTDKILSLIQPLIDQEVRRVTDLYDHDYLASAVNIAVQADRERIREWLARHAQGTLFDGKRTREDSPVEREIIVFGGKPYKEKGFHYWISVKELNAFWLALEGEE